MAAPRSGRSAKIVLTDADVAKIERMAGLGITRAKIARIMGFSESTLQRQRLTSSAVDHAIARGSALAEMIVGGHLWKRIEAGDMRAIRWWEMTRVGRSERVIQTSLDVPVASMTDEQLERLSNGEDPRSVLGRA
jgi:DNA-binding CsgD family transcriptional regulator